MTSENRTAAEPSIVELREQWLSDAAKADVERWAVGKTSDEMRAEASRLRLAPAVDAWTLFYIRAFRAELEGLAKATERGQ
jgi:hypothetical protein